MHPPRWLGTRVSASSASCSPPHRLRAASASRPDGVEQLATTPRWCGSCRASASTPPVPSVLDRRAAQGIGAGTHPRGGGGGPRRYNPDTHDGLLCGLTRRSAHRADIDQLRRCRSARRSPSSCPCHVAGGWPYGNRRPSHGDPEPARTWPTTSRVGALGRAVAPRWYAAAGRSRKPIDDVPKAALRERPPRGCPGAISPSRRSPSYNRRISPAKLSTSTPASIPSGRAL